MKNCKKNKDGLYVLKVPSFKWEFDQNEKELLDRYWTSRSGQTLDEIITNAEEGAASVASVLMNEALGKLEKKYFEEKENELE